MLAYKPTPETVSKIIGSPLANVKKYLPEIYKACEKYNMTKANTMIAILATVGVEVGSFAPINEYGGTKYFTENYEGRKDLGNIYIGDGAKYHGRGFIQLTGRHNYRYYGKLIGVDLENNPELALDPKVSSEVLVLYFKQRYIDLLASKSDWKQVRYRVNGGYNSIERFLYLVNAFSKDCKENNNK